MTHSLAPAPAPTQSVVTGCVLCDSLGGELIWSDPELRVIRVNEAGFPAFYRVVWGAHVAEFSDLSDAQRAHCMAVVVTVERCLREHLAPTKVNLASLGNVVAHVHWHVIARFDWDTHFPAPVWAQAARPPNVPNLTAIEAKLSHLDKRVAASLDALARVAV